MTISLEKLKLVTHMLEAKSAGHRRTIYTRQNERFISDFEYVQSHMYGSGGGASHRHVGDSREIVSNLSLITYPYKISN